jgi:hypothetical protein
MFYSFSKLTFLTENHLFQRLSYFVIGKITKISYKDIVCIYHMYKACYIPCPSSPSWFLSPNAFLWRVCFLHCAVVSYLRILPLWWFNTLTFPRRGTRWRSWLRHYATNRKVAGSISDGVIGIFHWHYPSGRTIALGLTLTEMNTRDNSWG